MTALPDDDWLLTIRPQRAQVTTSQYKHVGTFMKGEPGGLPTVANPVPVTIDWRELEY